MIGPSGSLALDLCVHSAYTIKLISIFAFK